MIERLKSWIRRRLSKPARACYVNTDDPALQFYVSIQALSDAARRSRGWARWDDSKGGATLWLAPASIYDSIPDGSLVVDIFYRPEVFKRGVSDNDTRGGALSFGVLCDRD